MTTPGRIRVRGCQQPSQMAMIRFNRLLKKVFGRPRCATLIQSPIPGRKKDSSLRDFGFENCVSSADFRVFQQPASDLSLTKDSQIGANLRVCADEEDRADFDRRN